VATRLARARAAFTLTVQLLLTIAVACASTRSPSPASFFAKGLFAQDADFDAEAATIATRLLSSMGEESLASAPPQREAYRLLWIQPFEPAVMVSLNLAEANVTVAKRRLNERKGTRASRRLRAAEIESIGRAVEASGFWSALQTEPLPAGQMAIDAQEIVIEGVRKGSYKALHRMFFEDDRAFKELVEAILASAPIKQRPWPLSN
jgi:hypothetical protein